MRILVIGGGGRLGGVTARALDAAGHRVRAFSRGQLDVTDVDLVNATINGLKPDVIINCSAYNAVDAAETDPIAAFKVNAHGPSALAAAASRVDAVLVHYGTDFIFDGRSTEPYAEDGPANPLNLYGASKLAGEHEVRRAPKHYILRVESLFGGLAVPGQKSTIDAIIDTLTAGDTVRALVDRTVSPSYIPDVVRVTRLMLEHNAPFGTYHCVSSGCTTWYDLANELARRLAIGGTVLGIRSDELKTIAARPRFCALSNRKLLALGLDLLSWRDALGEHLSRRLAETAPAQARIA
jgi:dTDP-4-dehydrorhamnose reductase